jgi:hypothetical protein
MLWRYAGVTLGLHFFATKASWWLHIHTAKLILPIRKFAYFVLTLYRKLDLTMTNFETESVARFAKFGAKLRGLFTSGPHHQHDGNRANEVGQTVDVDLPRQKITALSGVCSSDGISDGYKRDLGVRHPSKPDNIAASPLRAAQPYVHQRPGLAPRWKDMQRVSIAR